MRIAGRLGTLQRWSTERDVSQLWCTCCGPARCFEFGERQGHTVRQRRGKCAPITSFSADELLAGSDELAELAKHTSAFVHEGASYLTGHPKAPEFSMCCYWYDTNQGFGSTSKVSFGEYIGSSCRKKF